jgi:hypothetical protein
LGIEIAKLVGVICFAERPDFGQTYWVAESIMPG